MSDSTGANSDEATSTQFRFKNRRDAGNARLKRPFEILRNYVCLRVPYDVDYITLKTSFFFPPVNRQHPRWLEILWALLQTELLTYRRANNNNNPTTQTPPFRYSSGSREYLSDRLRRFINGVRYYYPKQNARNTSLNSFRPYGPEKFSRHFGPNILIEFSRSRQ